MPPAARLRIEKAGDSPWPAGVGVVEVWPVWPGAAKFDICVADGKPVHYQTVWSALGEPMLVRFDTSSRATTYYVTFVTNATSVAGAWNPEGGVLLETRRCKPQPVDTMDQVGRLLAAAEVAGRSFVPDIFLGINPHGPSVDYAALFSGSFGAPRTGDYEFATISSGPSYLQIDNRKVAEWLGRHDPHGGRRGEHSGRIQLKAGTHHIEYVQVQFEGEAAAVAAWKPPGQEHFEVMPSSAFLPVARFHATRFDPPPSAPDQLYCEWQELEHCRLGDSVIIKMRFRAIPGAQSRTYQWRFDDGDEAAGAEAQHFFLQAGARQVSLEARDRGRTTGTNGFRVRVEPRWSQREDWRQNVWEEAKQSFFRRDLSRLPARDLAEILELADRLEDEGLMSRAGEMLLKREADFTSTAYAGLIYRLGLSFQHQGDAGDRLAERALRLASIPSRSSSAITEKARLRIADLLIHCDGSLDEAQQILAGISGNGLSPDERRLAKLLPGDLLLAAGKADEARKRFLAVGDMPSRAGRLNPGRAARLEGISILIERGHYADAEQQLDRLTFESPLERIAPDTGLLRVSLGLKQKACRRVFSISRALLPGPARAQERTALLGALVESGLAIGRTEEAQRALRELLKDFPYSEAAARAKERWGAK